LEIARNYLEYEYGVGLDWGLLSLSYMVCWLVQKWSGKEKGMIQRVHNMGLGYGEFGNIIGDDGEVVMLDIVSKRLSG
jgi:hypothetical protein